MFYLLRSLIPEELAVFDSSFYILLLEKDKKLPTSASQRRKEKVSRTRKILKMERLQEQRKVSSPTDNRLNTLGLSRTQRLE